MNASVKAELLKLRTLRSFWWTAVALLAAVPVLVVSNIAVAEDVVGKLHTGEGVRSVFSAASTPLMLIVGIMLMAGEFRHRTAAGTFLTEPRRRRVVVAKLIASALVATLLALASAAVALAVGLPALSAKHVDLPAHAGDIAAALLGSSTATVLYALVGVGLGAAIRNQTVAISVALGWSFVVEGALMALADGVGRWLPGGAAAALSGGLPQGIDLLPVWAAALLFAAYGFGFAAAGITLIGRRDV